MAKLSLQERLYAPQELEENLVKMEINKSKIDSLREQNRLLKARNEKLTKAINEDQEFFKSKKVIIEVKDE